MAVKQQIVYKLCKYKNILYNRTKKVSEFSLKENGFAIEQNRNIKLNTYRVAKITGILRLKILEKTQNFKQNQ